MRSTLTEPFSISSLHFKSKISDNSNTYSGNIIDYFHKKCKGSSSSKSKSNTKDNIYNTALNVIKTTSSLTINFSSSIKNMLWKK